MENSARLSIRGLGRVRRLLRQIGCGNRARHIVTVREGAGYAFSPWIQTGTRTPVYRCKLSGLVRKQIAPNHRAVGINIKCFRHSGEGHAQRPSKRRSSERTIAAFGQTRSKWRAISSGKAARIKGTPEVDLELARRSSRQTAVPGREMEKILGIARETQ